MRKVSDRTISRALLYIRTLGSLINDNRRMVSSSELSEITGLSAAQIRKDISFFGKVGTPRLGYDTEELKKVLEEFILQKETIHVALFGAGNLGKAILRYPAFRQEELRIVAAFEKDPQKIGKTIGGVNIFPLEKASEIIQKEHVDLGVIAVPAEHGQQVADLIVRSGLKGIMNFAPVSLNVPGDVTVRDIDLTIEFLALFCSTQLEKHPETEGKMAKILLVDDDRDLLESGKMVLESEGHSVDTASNVGEAQANVKATKYDLILLDIMMESPDDGIDLAHKLKKDGVKAPVVMMSAVSRVTGYEYGKCDEVLPCTDFIEKPVTPKALIKKVNQVLKK